MRKSFAVTVLGALLTSAAFAQEPSPAPPVQTETQAQPKGMVDRALSWIGVRYRFGGQDENKGFDCAGLVRRAFASVRDLPRTAASQFREGFLVSREELKNLLQMEPGEVSVSTQEAEMIDAIFDLGETTVREVMVPRPDLVTIKAEKVLRQAMSLFLRSGFSRVPVVGEDTDDVLGMLYFKDVARAVNSNPDAAHAASGSRGVSDRLPRRG